MRKFGKIVIEGFTSIENLEFNFHKPGLNIITGDNGSGKTTLLSALTWAWFGSMLKGTKNVATWEFLRTKEFKGTKVESHLKIGKKEYKVIRCLKYKGKLEDGAQGKDRLLLYENGKLYTKYHDKRELQKHIENIIGYSYKLFINSIVFGQKMKRIIEETGPNQKALFDEAFESKFISDAREKNKKEHDSLSSDISLLIMERDSTEENMIDLKSTIEEYKESLNTYNIRQAYRGKEIDDKLFTLKKEEKALSKEIKKIPKLKGEISGFKLKKPKDSRDKLQELNKEYNGLIQEMDRIKSDIKILLSKLNSPKGKCHECNQPIESKSDEKNRIKWGNNKISLEEELEAIEDKALNRFRRIEELKNRVDRESSNRKSYNSKLETKYKLESSLESLKKDKKTYNKVVTQIEELQKEKSQLLSEKPPMSIKETERRFLKAKKKYKKLKKGVKTQKEELEILKWLVDGPLSNSGLKAYLFNILLSDLNKAMLKYSDIIQGIIKFGINNQSARKDFYTTITRGDNEVPYVDLSGGQQQLINIVIAFSIHDIITPDRPCNILLMDEVFDNLSPNNVELVNDLIDRKVSNKTSTYVVTHQLNFQSVNANYIGFTLENNFTSIV